MIDAVGGVTQVAVIAPIQPGLGAPEAKVVDLRQPSSVEAGDFARAVALRPQFETTASPPSNGDGLSNRLSQQVNALSLRLQGFAPAPAGSGAAVGGPLSGSETGRPAGLSAGNSPARMNEAIGQMERAYMFAIETTMASRGSTETTKIFNTLLKGQ